MARACGDKSRFLDDSLLHFESQRIKLPLQFHPDRSIFTGLRKPLPELPDRLVIRDDLWEAEELPERDPIGNLSLQFSDRKAPCHCWSTSSLIITTLSIFVGRLVRSCYHTAHQLSGGTHPNQSTTQSPRAYLQDASPACIPHSTQNRSGIS